MQDHRLNEHFRVAWVVIFATLLLVLTSMPSWSQSSTGDDGKSLQVLNPGAELWRDVRQRDTKSVGITQVRGVDSGELINPWAVQWTQFRTGPLVTYGITGLATVIVLIFLFYFSRGRVPVEGGPSGKMTLRFSEYERVIHWVMALVFLFLAITGAILLFGRELLIPLFGRQVFSWLASSAKESHNLFGPIFLLSLLLIFISFVKKNIYARGDLKWLARGGGIIGKEHTSSGFFNMGEKIWFWLLILLGLIISASGLILVSPSLGQSRALMELSHVTHATTALLLVAISFGHIYLATIGTEGTKEGMKSGYVDIRWAQLHHDRWAQECESNDRVISASDYSSLSGGDNSSPPDDQSAEPKELKS